MGETWRCTGRHRQLGIAWEKQRRPIGEERWQVARHRGGGRGFTLDVNEETGQPAQDLERDGRTATSGGEGPPRPVFCRRGTQVR